MNTSVMRRWYSGHELDPTKRSGSINATARSEGDFEPNRSWQTHDRKAACDRGALPEVTMERQLVIRAQGGDESAFAELAFGIGDRLFALAHRTLRDTSLAEDALQQALVTIWQELPGLRDPDRFVAWSYRVLVNACYAEGRRQRRWNAGLWLLPADRSQADASDSVADRDEVERAFRRLPTNQRAVLVLQHFLDMTLPEMAATLGIPIGTVRSRLHYAREAMRAVIEAVARPVAGGRPTRGGYA
jgi:RNA polymerase sigma-70 factor, ECF subfamily